MSNDGLEDLYRETILDHYTNPRGKRILETYDFVNHGHNSLCGDKVTVKVKLAGDSIEDMEVNSKGCAISVASGSIMAELLPGKSIEEIRKIDCAFHDMLQGKGIPHEIDFGELDVLEGVSKYHARVKCALLPWTVLEEIINKIITPIIK